MNANGDEKHDELLTTGEVATLFGVHRKTPADWADAGKLPYIMTPGGHRRYSLRDALRKLLIEKGHQAAVEAILRLNDLGGDDGHERPEQTPGAAWIVR